MKNINKFFLEDFGDQEEMLWRQKNAISMKGNRTTSYS